ncbi:MAG: methionine--tRNA ligase subunit beta [Omnitrophica WOR_2 bacterium GWF2_43_52]|nr:MAG: methionine--tRNA ligase subunit beta [Omnitrophica WOR_2 bacterium GWA2_44_7]OGX20393.1 MAG: methionine--tRNA ligase subunit beta [Omnitrophica WOR_2 bacterium GWF2_43_52]OGX56661.1 MAG: methionine--tRNA ligase subunit beta [Omnitrophica WOR_2 bacterium RIFOXYC2_FULL_43_9]HAH20662.1 methionine--tRNA ligase subunit beta [Candidatus Omnitrophota bacterium]HBG63009.1 methionine--tRNA ligase subunit beta [Candidatus Omnitrophota bacterium]
MDIKETPEIYLEKLKKERFNEQVNTAYGIVQSEANPIMAKIGFDGDKNRLGWTLSNLAWIFDNYQAVEKVLEDAESIRKHFSYVVFCGMGGSGLSVQLVKDTFGEKGVKIYSLRTTDPKAIKEILDEISGFSGSLKEALEKTLVLAISKSGTTIETVSHKKYFEELYKKSALDIKKHMWVITDKGSPMDTGDYPQREIQLNGKGDIGGRFTAPTTNIFLLPLTIVAPERVKAVLTTAQEMNECKDIQLDIFLKLGAFLYYYAARQNKDKLTMFVPKELKSLPSWFEQLLEESLGKDGKGISLFYGEKLSAKELKPAAQNDRVFFRINLSGKKTEQELWKHLEANKYPLFEIEIKDINSIGGILLGLQRAVAAIGYLWDICFVNQPAVEGYKKATKEVMKVGGEVRVPKEWHYAGYKGLKLYYSPLCEAGIITESELKKESGNLDDAIAVYASILAVLHKKTKLEAVELTSYGRMSQGLNTILEQARYTIFTSGLKLPAKLGEGPDKNHSYHQNIEAGKDMWFSTYVMAESIEQPQALAFDENLLKAQAIGTMVSLLENKRRVVLLTVDKGLREAEQEVKEFFDKVFALLSTKKIIQGSEAGLPARLSAKPMAGKAGNMVTYDEFRRLDIKVARIIEVNLHPNADKLYLLKIDLGDNQRQIVAGIRNSYKPEELVGKQVAVITNLEPAVIRGVESNGMLLAASDENGLCVISPQREVKVGSIIK